MNKLEIALAPKYKDIHGNIWYRVSDDKVWSETSGYGGWFDGAGLFRM